MQQYYEVHPDGGGRFLPDRYIEGLVRHGRMVHVETSATLVEQRMSHQNSRILSPR